MFLFSSIIMSPSGEETPVASCYSKDNYILELSSPCEGSTQDTVFLLRMNIVRKQKRQTYSLWLACRCSL